jgi:hypothetical protein
MFALAWLLVLVLVLVLVRLRLLLLLPATLVAPSCCDAVNRPLARQSGNTPTT